MVLSNGPFLTAMFPLLPNDILMPHTIELVYARDIHVSLTRGSSTSAGSQHLLRNTPEQRVTTHFVETSSHWRLQSSYLQNSARLGLQPTQL